jgi:hypothetical protein
MNLVGRTTKNVVRLAYRMCGATDYTLAYARACKTLVDCLSDPRREVYLEGEMIQPLFRLR